jgi:hypothetical protein
MGMVVPVLFGEFEGDVLAVVVFFVEDTFQFLKGRASKGKGNRRDRATSDRRSARTI